MQRHHYFFASIIEAVEKFDPIPLAVAYPLSEVSLRGVLEAADHGLVTPTLIGPVKTMIAFAAGLGIDISSLALADAPNEEATASLAVRMCRTGKADALIVPDLEAGNMLAKQLEYLAEAEAAGIVLGGRVPIILTSRADSAKCRLASTAVAVLLAQAQRTTGFETRSVSGAHHD